MNRRSHLTLAYALGLSLVVFSALYVVAAAPAVGHDDPLPAAAGADSKP